MQIYDKEHPHHLVWREATESLLAGIPKEVEFMTSDSDVWKVAVNTVGLSWIIKNKYRIKQEMHKIVVNGEIYEYPKPFTGTLCDGQIYYVSDILGDCHARKNASVSRGEVDVSRGVVHLTSEAAKAQTEVLRKICKL